MRSMLRLRSFFGRGIIRLNKHAVHQQRFTSDTSNTKQLRHKPALPLRQPREIIVACPAMKSNVNVSMLARAAGCFGVRQMIMCGNSRLRAEIARESASLLQLHIHRTLPPVLQRLRSEGYKIIGLEQTTTSSSIYSFTFPYKSVLVVGHEARGLDEDVLRECDHCIEIPVYGMPHSHNAAVAGAVALYEYCRQFPEG